MKGEAHSHFRNMMEIGWHVCNVLITGINPLEGVVMLASTNRVDVLDQALLRPGRFDRQIAINLPTLLERKAIFEVYLKRLVLEKAIEQYSSRLAALTPGHSGELAHSLQNQTHQDPWSGPHFARGWHCQHRQWGCSACSQGEGSTGLSKKLWVRNWESYCRYVKQWAHENAFHHKWCHQWCT